MPSPNSQVSLFVWDNILNVSYRVGTAPGIRAQLKQHPHILPLFYWFAAVHSACLFGGWRIIFIAMRCWCKMRMIIPKGLSSSWLKVNVQIFQSDGKLKKLRILWRCKIWVQILRISSHLVKTLYVPGQESLVRLSHKYSMVKYSTVTSRNATCVHVCIHVCRYVCTYVSS